MGQVFKPLNTRRRSHIDKKGDVQSSQFAIFLQTFKAKLQESFGEMENVEAWIYASGTSGWADALKATSEKYMPEIWTLWDQLDWWASDSFDSWLIDCASIWVSAEKNLAQMSMNSD